MKLRKIFSYGIILSIFFNMSNIDVIAFDENQNIANKSLMDYYCGDKADIFNSIVESEDEGYVAVGSSTSTNLEFEHKGSTDAIIVKFNKYGEKEWVKGYCGSSSDSFRAITRCQDGYIAVGDSASIDLEFENKGVKDAIIVKYDLDGNIVWSQSWGGNDSDAFSDVAVDNLGNITVVGQTYSTDTQLTIKGRYDAIIARYNRDGEQIWIKKFGGSYEDTFKSILIDDDNIIVSGESSSLDAGFPSNTGGEAILLKYSQNGELLWVKNWGGNAQEDFRKVIKTSDNCYIAVGSTTSSTLDIVSNGGRDGIIAKFDKEGNILWIKNYGQASYDLFKAVLEDSDRNILVIGAIRNPETTSIDTSVIVKYDLNGNYKDVKVLKGSKKSYFESAFLGENNDIVICGYGNSPELNMPIEKSLTTAFILRYNNEWEECVYKVKSLTSNISKDKLFETRDVINKMKDGVFKERLQIMLNNKNVIDTLELKTASSNLDIYIKSENILIMSLNTNQITFDDFSSVNDMLKDDVVEVSINSSLPYNLNAYLITEIQNSDKSKTMDKEILQLKEDTEVDYQYFSNIDEKIILKNNCEAGNDKTHLIDFKLKGGLAHEKDIYKTVIKFEAEQI